jgi:hypothetical protein
MAALFGSPRSFQIPQKFIGDDEGFSTPQKSGCLGDRSCGPDPLSLTFQGCRITLHGGGKRVRNIVDHADSRIDYKLKTNLIWRILRYRHRRIVCLNRCKVCFFTAAYDKRATRLSWTDTIGICSDCFDVAVNAS